MHRGANAPLTCTFPGLREHAVKERNQNIVKTLEHLVKHIKAAQEFTEKVKKKKLSSKKTKNTKKQRTLHHKTAATLKKDFIPKIFSTPLLWRFCFS